MTAFIRTNYNYLSHRSLVDATRKLSASCPDRKCQILMDKPPKPDLKGYPTFLTFTYTRYLNIETYLEIVEEQKMKIEIPSPLISVPSYLEILNFHNIKQPIEYCDNNKNHVLYISQ